jgi:hypothetical protein
MSRAREANEAKIQQELLCDKELVENPDLLITAAGKGEQILLDPCFFFLPFSPRTGERKGRGMREV